MTTQKGDVDRSRDKRGRKRRRAMLLSAALLAIASLRSLAAVQAGQLPFANLHRRRQGQQRSDTPELASSWTFHLHPTAALETERRRRKLAHVENTTTISLQHPDHWFALEQNAVYATIPDPLDPAHASDRLLREFHDNRHYSRYEREYQRHTASLHGGKHVDSQWNGQYDDEFFASLSGNLIFAANTTRTGHRPRRRRQIKTQGQQRPLVAPVSNNTAQPSHNRRHQRRQQVESKDQKQQTPTFAATTGVGGGQFNNYQSVPLSQGYGTHYAAVWIGSPTPQRKTVIVDTGSHYTAFPCSGCRNCGAPHHTDPYYRPEKSATFHQLQCSECQDGVLCDAGRCKFNQAYTEGSSWEAVQVKDRFYCGGTDVLDSVDPKDLTYAIDFMFGCQSSLTGLFRTQLADGIMGMSAHPATFPKKLYDEGKIEHNMFAMCFRRELGTSKRGVTAGSMTFGGVSNNLDTSPMVYAKNIAKIGWFTVFVKNIYVRTTGGQSAKSFDPLHQTIKVRVDVKTLNSGKGVIVDSGTTDTYLNKKVAKEFTKAWKKATGQTYSHTPMLLTAEQLRGLPTILIQCQAYSRDTDPSVDDYDTIPGYAGSLDPSSPKDLLIAIPATSYMDFSPITKRYMSRLYFTETVGGVLGSNTMQGHNVLFDWQNGRVGFAESTCAYDKKDVPSVAEDTGFDTDCRVGDPILSKSCIDTVDRRMCKLNPTGIALLGKESWTAVVESPGNDAGVSCVEASLGVGGKLNEMDDPIVTCNGHGVCEEGRPCQLTCAEALAAAKVGPLVTSPEGKPRSCGNSGWSACDYGCMQTRTESNIYSDGICHEVDRKTRPCHIGACARSDPCRVPFIVHVVLAFRDGSVANWSQDSEEIIATALANVVRRRSDDELFTVGDVNVAMALPWYQDQDELDAGNVAHGSATKDYGDDYNAKKLGLKVVIEVAMYNAMADAINRTSQFEDQSGEDLSPLSAILRNVTNRMGVRKPPTQCFQEELFALAKRALRTKVLLRENRIMSSLIDELKITGDETGRSAFGPIDSSNYNSSESFLLSAWTIRTGLEDEVNYFGPQKPFTAKIVAFLQNTILLSLAFFFLMILWSCALTSYDLCRGKPRHGRLHLSSLVRGGHQHYSVVTTNNNEDHEAAIMLHTVGDVELTPTKRNLKRRPKRVDSFGA